jgi:uncharacterized protein YdaU (DUF1376 family)
VNYYERHIGDYLKDTAHLSMLEHGAYTRLLDVYYTREGGIPAADAARLVGARSKEERAALAAVLAEFFELREGVLIQHRADREIQRFQDKQRKASASANARWAKSGGNANASADAMRTHTEGNAPRARPQTPDTRPNTKNQERAPVAAPPPERATSLEPVDLAGHQPTPAGIVCRAMRTVGMQATNPGDPRLLTLLEQGATEAEFVGIATEAVAGGKGWAWVLHVLAARRGEAAAIRLAPAVADDPWETRGGVERIAATVGIGRWDECRPWPEYVARVRSAAGQPKRVSA